MKNQHVWAITILSVIVVFSSSSSVFAHPHPGQNFIDSHTHESQTEYFPINGIIGIEKTSILFHSPQENSFPWGFVEGKIANPVKGYPVIIQIFNNDEPVHFAQTEVAEDGTYEYRFRVLNVENNQTIKIFAGDYYVTIFKVVYLDQSNSI